eukprot:scaffold10316_cov71-Cyclotella_meneghiniana.AAC.8
MTSVISGVVFPMNNSLDSFSSADTSPVIPGIKGCPVNCCQVECATKGPAYFEGRDTFKLAPKKGMPVRFITLLASSTEVHSTKANF